jgi:imidazolonepropionase-like amidohydrolase
MRVLAVLILLASPLLAVGQRDTSLPVNRFNQAGTYALTHVSVIDGTGGPVKRDQTVVIDRGRMAFVGDAASAPIPASAEVLDLTGRTVFPGLVMMHEHLHNEPNVSAELWLARGVTTVRTGGAFEPTKDLNLRQWIREGRTPGPELFLTAPFLSEHAEHLVRISPLLNLRDVEHARRAVRFWAAEGFDSIKVYAGMTPKMLRVVVEEARKHRLPVLGHIQAVTCTEAAEIGMDSIEHGIMECVNSLTDPDAPRLRDPETPAVRALFATLVKHRVAISETPVDLRPLTEAELAVLHPGSRDDYQRRFAAGNLGPGARTVTDDKLGPPGLTMAFIRAGGTVFLGSDSGGMPRIPGFSNLRSLKLLYTNHGFEPVEAIRIATQEGAKFLRIDERTGTIATNKEADLVVVRGDPSTRMRDVDNIEIVSSNGIRFDPAKLLEANRGLYRFAAHQYALPR